ncbi:hypothetical protein Tco_0223013 [Tanacetum coccineum]
MSKKAKDPKVIAKKISHKPIDYENLNSLTDDFEKRFSPQQELLAEQAFWFHILNPSIESSFTPPVIVEVPSELPNVSLVNASLKKLKFHLTQFDSVVKKRTIPNALEEGEWGSISTKDRNQAKMTKLTWNGKAVQNQRPRPKMSKSSQYRSISSQNRSPELKYNGCNLNPSDGPGKPKSITMKTVKTKWALNQFQQPICVQLTKTVKTLKAQS